MSTKAGKISRSSSRLSLVDKMPTCRVVVSKNAGCPAHRSAPAASSSTSAAAATGRKRRESDSTDSEAEDAFSVIEVSPPMSFATNRHGRVTQRMERVVLSLYIKVLVFKVR
jgi:hypothetical protein